jgi:ribosome-binding factor A
LCCFRAREDGFGSHANWRAGLHWILKMGKHRTSRDGEGRAAGVRHPRLEELFREELNSILDFEITDPRLDGTRISMVELSRDGSRARVWVSFQTDTIATSAQSALVLELAFERAAGFFRRRLCEALPLKRMPDLSFRLDPAASVAHSHELEPE